MKDRYHGPDEKRVFERFVPSKQAFIMDENGFGIIKDISLGGIALYCVNGSKIGQSKPLDIFLANSVFSLPSEQYVLIEQRLTPGQAIIINHIRFDNLSSIQLDSLWALIKRSCERFCAQHPPTEEDTSSVSFWRHRSAPSSQGTYTDHPPIVSQKSDTASSFTTSTIQ